MLLLNIFMRAFWAHNFLVCCKSFLGPQLFGLLCFLFLLNICQDNFSVDFRNVLLLNKGRVRLINFVTINLLGFPWFFLAEKVKALIRANTKYTK